MKTVNRTVRALLFSALLLAALLLPARSAKAAPTDEILNFTITVDVNEDASLKMTYHIDWKVLDNEEYGPPEWVNLR